MKLIKRRSKLFSLVILVVLVATAVFIALNASGKRTYEKKFLEVDKMAEQAPEMPADVVAQMKKEANEMKTKGYIETDDEMIPPTIDNYPDEMVNQMKKLDEIKTNFEIVLPSWLPKDSKLLGVIPSGELIADSWDSITIVYDTPKGQINIGQAKPRNGGAVYPEELATEKIRGNKAIVSVLKGKKGGRRWSSYAWNVNNIEFSVEGELPLGTLKKVAESL